MDTKLEQKNALQTTLQRVTETPEFKRVVDELNRGARVISISGLVAGSARALALAALQRATGRLFAIVTQSNRDLEPWEADLRFWYCALAGKMHCENEVLILPASESDPYAGSSPHPETLEQRALALWRLANHSQDFVLLTARALARRTVAPDEIKAAGAFLARSDSQSPEELVYRLVAAGYMREDPVGAVGEFSMRGGILDLWSPGQAGPVRIEFFGDEVDSIRGFDPETQLSTSQLKEIEIVPMRELVVRSQDFADWAIIARERWDDVRFARALRDRTEFADEGESFNGWEWLMTILRDRNSCVFDYLKDAVLVVDEPTSVDSYLGEVYQTLADRFAETDAADDIALQPQELYLPPEELRAKLDEKQRIELRILGRAAAELDQEIALDAEAPKVQLGRARSVRKPLFLFPTAAPAPETEWKTQSVLKYHGRVASLAEDLVRSHEDGITTLFVMPSTGVAERVAEILAEYGIDARLSVVEEPSASSAAAQTIVTVGRLSAGFEMSAARLITHVEADLFDEASSQALDRRSTGPDGRRQAAGARKKKSKTAAFLSDFRDLRTGDYVVHVDHGIARFGGLQTLNLGERSGEFMLLYYAEDAKLYVPVERLDLVQRYSSGEGAQPTLDRLGGIGWQKTKAKAKRAMRDMADELLRLYAERKLVGGFAFAADTPWQREFEDGFEYVLTPDQETAIEDVKHDMQEPTPMDRLLCGDVGYGKTEVAMRAAFKAVMEGKQTAVLTPTTVLAYQHYDTFRSRFAPFPVKVELLSRFRNAKEQKEIAKRVESGEVDVVIGTHRLLSKDVRFKELGLVVVDEEQRFGVAHKERLKHLKKKVDVLTLSATPIPRTLNMSLSGLRDMSLIETPPRDRLAIQTQVVQFSENVIKSAIELELGRAARSFSYTTGLKPSTQLRPSSSVWCLRRAWWWGTGR